MEYRNLRAEMARKNITIEEIAKEIGIHRNSVSNKINGPSSFSIEEAMKIKDKFFPLLEYKYLFAVETGEEKGE